MALVDPSPGRRDFLPSINLLELDKVRIDRPAASRFSMMPGLSISTAPLGSPKTVYSGPPPPYSYPSSTVSSAHSRPGYMSPPDPARSLAKDDKDLFVTRQSLPSLSEALGQDKSIPFPAPPPPPASSTALPSQPLATPSSTVGHSFSEAPVGPSNPFSQSGTSIPSLRDCQRRDEPDRVISDFAHLNATEVRPQPSQSFGVPKSGDFISGPPKHSLSSIHTSLASGFPSSAHTSPSVFPAYRSPFTFTNRTPLQSPSVFQPPPGPHRHVPPPHGDDPKQYVSRTPGTQSYGESVKRHLDVFDTHLALNEMAEASAHAYDFSRTWCQRVHQTLRPGYLPEVLPDLQELDEIVHQSNRVLENLSRVREAVVAQHAALAEQRARTVKGDHFEDEYGGLQDDFKGPGGFAGGDAKKRRGKAAPPGRCHSCNRAETPEWRRGPDGARTLCNACGLHYAKLTRKMGVNKALPLAGSGLRPKTHDPRSPRQ